MTGLCKHRGGVYEATLDILCHHGVIYGPGGEKIDECLTTGPDSVVDYLKHLLDKEEDHVSIIAENIPMKKLTYRQEVMYHTQTYCAVKHCQKLLDRSPGRNPLDAPTRDHDHLSGKQ